MNAKPITVALAVAVGAGSCIRHPAATVGLTFAGIGFGTCELDDTRLRTCAAIGAIAGVGFGLLSALVFHFTNSTAPPDTAPGSGACSAAPLDTFAPPLLPPMALDAGIDAAPIAPIAIDAGIDAAQVDAGP